MFSSFKTLLKILNLYEAAKGFHIRRWEYSSSVSLAFIYLSVMNEREKNILYNLDKIADINNRKCFSIYLHEWEYSTYLYSSL